MTDLSFTISLGWWLVPAAITLGSLICAFIPDKNPSYGSTLVGLFQFGLGLVLSLSSWLVWSLLR
jgi:hypothetical protein